MNRAVLLAALLLCGCVGRSPVDPPLPEPDVEPTTVVVDQAAVRNAYQNVMRLQAKVQRDTAAAIRAGQIKSAVEELAFTDPRVVKARIAGLTPLAKMENDALGEGQWTAEKAAAFRDALADALEAGL